ncbi:hypothetical protein D1AOALGA4SA_11629 [Olavius algarvensis Delta 1 endosymbiont]|nr:hypothetical protein D1AOALGA4SA_11629 [Olavius algarvensis Delta 1 endosymbiont]
MSASKPADTEKNPRHSSSDDRIGFDDIPYNDKVKVECICPKCDRKHSLNLHWIGRGTPRKYCHACKGGHVE